MIRAVPSVVLAAGLMLTLAAVAPAQTPAPAQAPLAQGQAPLAQGQPPRPAPPPQATPQPSTPPAGTAAQPRPAQGGVAPTATDRIGVDRARPRTYARCNRAALRRSLKGGERRRFITRCRLNYDIPPRPR